METNNQEIDLVYLFRKIKNLCTRINISIFRLMQMILKNILWLTALVVTLAVVGYFIEKNTPQLKSSELIVSPNFQSNDYLYERINTLNKNKSSFLAKYPALAAIKSIKIEQIENYYDLINKDFQAFKTLTDNGRYLSNFIEEKSIEKDFRYHKIKIISTDEVSAQQLVEQFLKMLNEEPYIEAKRQSGLMALKERKNQLEVSITHINKLLERLGQENSIQKTSDLNVNTYAQLHEVIELKEKYSAEISRLNVQIIEGEKTIYPISEVIGAKYKPFILLRLPYLLPIASLLLLLFGYRVKRFYQKYALLTK